MPIYSGPSRTFLMAIGAVVSIWLTAIVTLGRLHVFNAPPSTPPLAMMAAMLGPPLMFICLLKMSRAFRGQIMRIDPVWLAAVHGLRMVGGGFLFVYAFNRLPGLFAHPAGWGDMLVAFLAPIMATKLARDSTFISSKTLWRFHAVGMLDFAGAIIFGLLARVVYPAVDGVSSTNALAQLPLVLIPAFAVPLWICLHLAAFAQIRQAREHAGRWPYAVPTAT